MNGFLEIHNLLLEKHDSSSLNNPYLPVALHLRVMAYRISLTPHFSVDWICQYGKLLRKTNC